MKKSFIIIGIFLLLLILPFIITQQAEVDKATQCLENKIKSTTCSSLSTEEKIFSLLAVQKCEAELLTDAKDNECWPKSDCKIKQTAQAALALDSVGTSADKTKTWLLSQTATPSDIIWYLQIDSNEQTSCSITYSGLSYQITILEDKTINTNAGDCLRLSQDNYWFRVTPSCYAQEFTISCDKSFKTNLIFKQTSSPTFYISQKINSGSAQSLVKEKVNSKCFSQQDVCDYEGSLWATLALKQLDADVSPYVPYLITAADKNERYLPESFLYLLAGSSYYDDLLAKQKNNQYWETSGDKFYDTALALYPLQPDTSEAKTNSVNWLLANQNDDGCWDNIRNTGFILYSVWPIKPVEGDCGDSGGYCLPEVDCEGKLSNETCVGGLKCCSIPAQLKTCSQMNGEICTSTETCDGDTVKSSDAVKCCLGSCGTSIQPTKSECELNNGVCRTIACQSGETTSTYTCDYYSDICCIKKTGNYWYIWLLLILILLTIIGIIFKDKLRSYWFGLTSKFGKPSQPPSQPPSQRPMFGIPRRRVLPFSQQRPVRRPMPTSASRSELDEVLKKLKDIGK